MARPATRERGLPCQETPPATMNHPGVKSVTESTAACSWATRATAVRAVLLPLIAQARSAGPLPALGSPQWVAAEPQARSAAAFVELVRHVDAETMRVLAAVRDRREAPLRAQREASHAISAAVDWTAASKRPSYAELQRLRGEVA